MPFPSPLANQINDKMLKILGLNDSGFVSGIKELSSMVDQLDKKTLYEVDETGGSLLIKAVFLPMSSALDPSFTSVLLKDRLDHMTQLFITKGSETPSAQVRTFFLPAYKGKDTVFLDHDFWKRGLMVSVYMNVLNSAIERNLISGRDFAQALLQRNDKGISPLNRALAGRPENLDQYFESLENCVTKNWITAEQYAAIFLECSGNNFTSLVSALMISDERVVRAYFKALQSAVDKEWISVGAYKKLLSQRVNNITPLENAARHEQPGIIKCYFDLINRVFNEKELLDLLWSFVTPGALAALHSALLKAGSPEVLKSCFQFVKTRLPAHYRKFFLKKTNMDLTFLHLMLSSEITEQHPDNIRAYFEILEADVRDKTIDEAIFARMLLSLCPRGGTVLNQVLLSCNQNMIKIFLERIKKALQIGLITQDDYTFLLFEPNSEGFTPMVGALGSHDSGIVSLYSGALNEARTKDWITRNPPADPLIQCNKDGFSPLFKVLSSKNAAFINYYFKMLDDALSSKRISEKQLTDLLFGADLKAGATPLLHALSLKDSAVVQCYFDYVLRWIDKLQSGQNVAAATYAWNRYVNALISPNEATFTPVIQAIASYNSDIVKRYFKELKVAHDLCKITLRQYTAVLTKSTCAKGGQTATPLLWGLNHFQKRGHNSENAENVELYLETLEQAFRSRMFNQDDREAKREYAAALTPGSRSHVKFTPLELALKAVDPDNLKAYLKAVATAVQLSVISNEEYADLLTRSHNQGFNPFHHVCHLGARSSIQYFIEFVFNVFSQDVMRCHRDKLKNALLARTRHNPSSCLDFAVQNGNCDATTFEWLLGKLREELAEQELAGITPDSALQTIAERKGERKRVYGEEPEEGADRERSPEHAAKRSMVEDKGPPAEQLTNQATVKGSVGARPMETDEHDKPYWLVDVDDSISRFSEQVTLGSDDSFAALGVARQGVVDCLMRLVGQPGFHDALLAEIHETLEKGGVKTKQFSELKERLKWAKKQYERFVGISCQHHPKFRLPQNVDQGEQVTALVEYLNGRGFAQAAHEITHWRDAVVFAENALREYPRGEEAVRCYIAAMQKPGGLRLSCQCALAYAYENNIRLRIFKRVTTAHGRVSLNTHLLNKATGPARTVSLLLAEDPRYFNKLTKLEIRPQAAQERAVSLPYNPALFREAAKLEEQTRLLASKIEFDLAKKAVLEGRLTNLQQEIDKLQQGLLETHNLNQEMLNRQSIMTAEASDMALQERRYANQVRVAAQHEAGAAVFDANCLRSAAHADWQAARAAQQWAEQVHAAAQHEAVSVHQHSQYIIGAAHANFHAAQQAAGDMHAQSEYITAAASHGLWQAHLLAQTAMIEGQRAMEYWQGLANRDAYLGLDDYRKEVELSAAQKGHDDYVPPSAGHKGGGSYIMPMAYLIPCTDSRSDSTASPYQYFLIQFPSNPGEACIYVAQKFDSLVNKSPLYLRIEKSNPDFYGQINQGLCCIYPDSKNKWVILQDNYAYVDCDVKPLYPGYLSLEEGDVKFELGFIPGLNLRWPEATEVSGDRVSESLAVSSNSDGVRPSCTAVPVQSDKSTVRDDQVEGQEKLAQFFPGVAVPAMPVQSDKPTANDHLVGGPRDFMPFFSGIAASAVSVQSDKPAVSDHLVDKPRDFVLFFPNVAAQLSQKDAADLSSGAVTTPGVR